MPVLIFLHGSGGNFKAYLWLLSQLADRLKIVVLAPSYGMGDWRWPETSKVVEAALVAARKQVAIAEDEMHVMGLSNGGRAVCQLMRDAGPHFKSLVFLSPVFDAESMQSLGFSQACQHSKVFVLTGAFDDRVPTGYVRGEVEAISRMGGKVTLEVVDKADHFLFFSHREQVLATLEKWLSSEPGAEQ